MDDEIKTPPAATPLATAQADDRGAAADLIEALLEQQALRNQAGYVEVVANTGWVTAHGRPIVLAALVIGNQVIAITDPEVEVPMAELAVADQLAQLDAGLYQHLARAAADRHIRLRGENAAAISEQLAIWRDTRWPRNSLLEEIEDEYSPTERLSLARELIDRTLDDPDFSQGASGETAMGAEYALECLRQLDLNLGGEEDRRD